jgi:hypothetical protein
MCTGEPMGVGPSANQLSKLGAAFLAAAANFFGVIPLFPFVSGNGRVGATAALLTVVQ